MAGSTFRTLVKAHDAVTVAAGSDLLASTECKRSGVLEISVCLDTSTTVQLTISDTSDDTEATVVELVDLNGGAALNAGVGYAFTWPALTGQSYGLRNKTGGTTTRIRSAVLRVEVPVG